MRSPRVFFIGVVAAATVAAGAAPAHAQAPANDTLAGAVDVVDLGFTDTVDTSEATYDENDTGCGAATVWYALTLAEAATVEIHTAGSDYDTTLAFHVEGPSGLEQLQCNDDSVYGLQSQIITEVEPGQTYYISAGTCCGEAEMGSEGPGGQLVFTVQAAPDPVTSVQVTVDRSANVSRDGVAIVTGTVVCDQPAGYWVDVHLTQRFGRFRAEGWGFASGSCSESPTGWTAEIWSSGSIVLGPGRGNVTANAWASNESGEAGDEVQQRVRLRRGRA